MEITIERVSGPTSDASALIAELDEVSARLRTGATGTACRSSSVPA